MLRPAILDILLKQTQAVLRYMWHENDRTSLEILQSQIKDALDDLYRKTEGMSEFKEHMLRNSSEVHAQGENK